ncbi:3-keto-5-aminohexanoate cleavage protein [Aquabacter sp. CN5-332]|uniref:3-keto-5-aminohexanoate cleavage protein n=1 Tax=Aquabacter sp. CN5-332 TaxID=3156608 RepID=UPI0032B4BD5B
MGKTILTVAVTGNQTTLAQHPGLPCTPEQIANAAIESCKAGAAVAHIHVRYDNGKPSMELEHYREVVDRIRDSGCGLVINLTTGPGQRFVPGAEDPKVFGPGTTLMAPEKRVEHILALKPEICTLDLNTMWSGDSCVINSPKNVTIMANAMKEAGSKPELEVFDTGDIQLAKQLIKDGVLEEPALFQIVTGIRYGFPGTVETLVFAKSLLPENAHWAAFGIGRMMFPMVAAAWTLGAHVRCGFEDGVQIRRGELAKSNAQQVEKAARIIDDLGGELATPDEARAILGLKK